MSALHELQQAFAASLLCEADRAVHDRIIGDGLAAAERLRIYRNTFISTLTAALRMTYPAVDRLVGREFFDAAAEQFIHANPPSSAYLNEYGEAFADFLAAFEPARTLPYLPDVARFEWALSAAANAIDVPPLTAEALATIDPAHHAVLRFEPHPSVRVLALNHPADQIADAVTSGNEATMAEVDLSSGPLGLVVHRGANGVESQRLAPDAFIFVSRLCAGAALGRLLQDAPTDAPALIAEQLTKGRLAAFRIQQGESP